MNRLIAFDRDGTLHQKTSPGRFLFGDASFELLEGVIDTVERIQELGYATAVCTNQRGISESSMPAMTRATVDQFNDRINCKLVGAGLNPLPFFVCPHGDEAECSCRKPRPGLLYQALISSESSVADSWFIGDSECDMQAANFAMMQPVVLCSEREFLLTPGALIVSDWITIRWLIEIGVRSVLRPAAAGGQTEKNEVTTNRNAYNSIVQKYSQRTGRFHSDEQDLIGGLMDQYLSNLGNRSVMDLGCGPARDASMYIKRDWLYIGVDNAEKMLQVAKRDLSSLRRQHRWALVNSGLLQLKWPCKSLTLIVANSVIQHVRKVDFRILIHRLSEWLVDGGLLYLHFRVGDGERLETSFEYSEPGEDGTIRFFVYYSVSEIERLLEENGFKVVFKQEYETDYEKDDPVKKMQVPTKARIAAVLTNCAAT